MNKIFTAVSSLSRSLSVRLLMIFVLGTMLYAYAARYAFTLFQDTDYLRQIVGAHIVLHTDYLLEDIGSPPDIERAKSIVERIPVDIRIVGPDIDWSSDPHFYPLENVPFGPLELLELGEASRTELESWAKQLENVAFARYHEHFFIRLEDSGYQIVFASPRISEMPDADYSTLFLYLAGGAVLFLCYLAVRWVFRPIKWMQVGAAHIGAGDLDYRIPTRRHDELGDLSREFNTMAADVQGMLDAKQQLMLAISHELRSPLTRSKVSVEFIEDETVRNSILEDLGEMERLTADLLESEALNTRHAVLRRQSIDLAILAEQLIAEDFAGQAERIDLQCEPTLEAELDATRMRLLLKNLIENALRYNPDGADPVSVMISARDDRIFIRVQDHGPGIPAEHIERVAEPFYRADPARARATGGFGLGLYLCKRIVEVHGGVINLSSPPGQGTIVDINMPRNDA